MKKKKKNCRYREIYAGDALAASETRPRRNAVLNAGESEGEEGKNARGTVMRRDE